MGTTVATNALLERKGDRTASRDHARVRGRAAHRRPEATAHLRAAHRAARAALRARRRNRRARDGATARCSSRWTKRAARAALQRGIRRRHPLHRHRVHARLPLSRARDARLRRSRAASASRAVSTSHETSRLMKLVGRGDTTVVDAYVSPLLRRYVDAISAELGPRRAAFLHAVERRAGRGARVSGQGFDSFRSRGRHRRHGAGCAARPGSTRPSASTWAARPRTSRTTRAPTSAASSP